MAWQQTKIWDFQKQNMTNHHLSYAFDDFISLKVLFASILSLVITVSIIATILYLGYDNAGNIFDLFVQAYTDATDYIYAKLEDYPAIAFIIEHKIFMLMFNFVVYFGLGVVFYYTFFIIYVFILSFFNPMFIGHIQKKYYPEVKLKGMNIFLIVFFYIKTILITLVLFVILSPAFLIPGLNLLMFLPIYYFFHKTLVFDVSSVINNQKEYKKIKKVNWSELKSHTIFCYLLSFIPFIGILIYPFYIFYVGHYIIKETEELRAHIEFNN